MSPSSSSPFPTPTPSPVRIVWDWNGTLLDDVDAAVAALNQMLHMRGVPPVSRDYYRAHFGFPVRPFYARLGVDLEHEDWDAICVDFHRFIAVQPQSVRSDAAAALALAHGLGYTQSILSALRQDLLRRAVDEADLTSYFDEINGVDNLDGASKLDLGRAMLARLAPRGERLVFIGDTLHDAEVAAALGGECILVGCGHQTAERLAATGLPVVPNLVTAVKSIQ